MKMVEGDARWKSCQTRTVDPAIAFNSADPLISAPPSLILFTLLKPGGSRLRVGWRSDGDAWTREGAALPAE
jgi:hypothetical protein